MPINPYQLHLQKAQAGLAMPSRPFFQRCVNFTLTDFTTQAELTIRIVDVIESAYLNETYRGKTGPTNILSFPFEAPVSLDSIEAHYIGDIVICAALVQQQAEEQNKPARAHWAHLVVHGTLHLLGYDHIEKEQAEEMEALEIAILKRLGYPNPY